MKPDAPLQMIDFTENHAGGHGNSASPAAGGSILQFPECGQKIPEMCLDPDRYRRSLR
jgi:hypothetical protein